VADALAAADALVSQVGNLQALIATSKAAVQTLRAESNIATLLRELIGVLETRYAAQEATITFDDSQVDASEVWVDPHRLRQVLSSLLSQRLVNAKRPVLNVTLRTEVRSRALVQVEIEWTDVSGSRRTRAAPPVQFGMQVGTALAESLGAELTLLSTEPMRLLLRFIAPRAKMARTDA
jgi:two-component system sensor histidine kinase EvgS/two-component system response regulator EvgA